MILDLYQNKYHSSYRLLRYLMLSVFLIIHVYLFLEVDQIDHWNWVITLAIYMAILVMLLSPVILGSMSCRG